MKKKMKRKIFVINEASGWFASNEEDICKEYCRIYGYSYRVEYVNFGY